ncbi:DUF134 domain-containing protein [Chakrabartyella piscis]|uniref:DUF134 domain-containing protein n=1 Tax=Chakrabartyella piscis TaxID=2918914 RepID=UPI002958DA8D|nr:DUF134 domain-containing protein [Chakrabartyella piscis]
MARPKKIRKICTMPENSGFVPLQECGHDTETIIMAIDEYETIRLIDLFGYTQEECAKQMQIARTTVQAMYNDARKKMADALVNRKSLCVEGGDVNICQGAEAGNCGRENCLCGKQDEGVNTNE